MTPEGKERRRLGGFGMPEWSPDGKSILAISFSSPTTLSLIDVATGKEQAIALSDHTIHSIPAWAGDSQTLIAVVRAKGLAKIALLDITESAAAKIKKVSWSRAQGTDPEPTHPVYEPETGRIAFVGRTSQGASLFTLDARSGSTPQQVEPGRYDPRIASLELAPDGKQLLFCAERAPDDQQRVRPGVRTETTNSR
jgi:Tol biopolymer transport system component